MSERIKSVDFARSILIFLVIFGHISEAFWRADAEKYSMIRQLWIFIYYFHIPAFAMISGYLSGHKGRTPDITALFNSLIIPYIVFQVLYRIYLYKSNYITDLSFHFLSEPYVHLWYLPGLFFWRMMLPFFLDLRYSFFLAFCIGLFSIFMPDAALFMSAGRIIRFFPYFLFGALFFDKGYHIKEFQSLKFKYTAALIFLIFTSVTLFFPADGDETRVLYLFPDENGNSIYTLIHRLRMYAAGFILSFILIIYSGAGEKFINLLIPGKYSIYPYVLHMFAVALALQKGYLGRLASAVENEFALILILFIISISLGFLAASFPARKLFGALIEPDSDKIKSYGSFIFIFLILIFFYIS